MPITAKAPSGGTVEQLGGESRPLLLLQGDIERFEAEYDVSIFDILNRLLGDGDIQSRYCRDLVALGLVGGGLTDRTADALVAELPPYENHRVRAMAQDLVAAAFIPPDDGKKKDDQAGSSKKTGRKATKQNQK